MSGKTWISKDLGGYVWSVDFSPDGTKIVAGLSDGRIVVFSSLGEKLWESRRLGGSVNSVAWSPEGDRLAAVGEFGKVVIYSDLGKRLWESEELGRWMFDVTWSPYGDKLALGVNSSIFVFSASGSRLWKKRLKYWVNNVAWSPNGRELAAGVWWEDSTGKCHSRIIILSSNGKKLREFSHVNGWTRGVAWSPKGDKIAEGGNLRSVIVFSTQGKKLWEKNLRGWVDDIAWSLDGDKIIIAAGTKVIILSTSGVKLWGSKDLGNNVWCVAWSPRGNKVVAGVGWIDASGHCHGKVITLSTAMLESKVTKAVLTDTINTVGTFHKIELENLKEEVTNIGEARTLKIRYVELLVRYTLTALMNGEVEEAIEGLEELVYYTRKHEEELARLIREIEVIVRSDAPITEGLVKRVKLLAAKIVAETRGSK